MGGDAKKLLEESKMLLKEAEKKEEEVRKVVKENIHADTADKIEERLDEVKAMIGKVTSKSGEVKELVQTGKPADMAKDFKEGKKEVLVSKDMNVVEAEVPDSKKRYLSKLGIQQEVAKSKLTEDVKKPEVQVMKMPAVIVTEAVKTPEANKVTEHVVKGPEVEEAVKKPEVKKTEVKEAVKLEVKEAVIKPEVKKTEGKEAVKKLEVKEEVKKPKITEAVKKPEIKEDVKKSEGKEGVKQPEVKEAVEKTEGKEEVKKTVEKSEVKMVNVEVKKVEELMEVKAAAMKICELAPTCDVITIGKKEPTAEQEASVPIIEDPVVEKHVDFADAVGEDFLSAADMEESDVSCDEEDIGWDSETLAWAMGSDAEMRPKNIRYPQDQVLRYCYMTVLMVSMSRWVSTTLLWPLMLLLRSWQDTGLLFSPFGCLATFSPQILFKG